jgi:hypothetical protein
LQSQGRGVASTAPITSAPWASEFHLLAHADIQAPNPQLASPPDQLTKIPKTDDAGSLSGWIEALGVDPSYRPPIERIVKPIACFYIMHQDPTQPARHEYYRAVYLMQRTLTDFTNSIALKWNLEPTKIMRCLHILDRGLEVEMDDDIIHELAEGQDLRMEIREIQNPNVKREWEMSVDIVVDSNSAGATQNVVHNEGYELRLIF